MQEAATSPTKEITLLQRAQMDFSDIKRKSEALEIRDTDSLNFAAETVAIGKRIVTVLDKHRVEEKEPHLKAGQEVDEKHFAIIKPCKLLVEVTERKMAAYQRQLREEAERQRQEAIRKQVEAERAAEEERKRLEAERLKQAKKNEKKNLPPPPPVVAPAAQVFVPPPVVEIPTAVQTNFGTMKIKQEWTFEVVDIALVPNHFLCVDERRVKEAIKTGTRTIAGLRIFER